MIITAIKADNEKKHGITAWAGVFNQEEIDSVLRCSMNIQDLFNKTPSYPPAPSFLPKIIKSNMTRLIAFKIPSGAGCREPKVANNRIPHIIVTKER